MERIREIPLTVQKAVQRTGIPDKYSDVRRSQLEIPAVGYGYVSVTSGYPRAWITMFLMLCLRYVLCLAP